MPTEAIHEIELLIRSRHGLILVDTAEEQRLTHVLRRCAMRLETPFHTWTVAEGLVRDGKDGAIYDSKDAVRALAHVGAVDQDGLVYLKDLHRELDDVHVLRALRDLATPPRRRVRALVIAAPGIEVPAELEAVATRYRLALPSREELSRLLHDVVRDLTRSADVRVGLDDAAVGRLLDGLRGLTLVEAERAITRAVMDDQALTEDDVERLHARKRELLEEGGVVSYVPPHASDVAAGGMHDLRAWLAERQRAFTDEARAFGLPPPRGVVLLGVQGCGKTLAARMIAEAWSLPLLRLEPGRLYQKWMGESEKALDRALHLAESMAPCVLLVDEIEKGFAAAGSQDVDGGVSQRVLGRLLGWLQDRREPVFVVATSNDVSGLPPELLRKGRFDEIFFVDLPDPPARKEILALHLSARDRDPATFDLDAVAAATEDFSGAELEQVVVAGLYSAFARGASLDTETLLAEAAATRPLAVTRREDVEALRRWARARARPA